MSTTKWTQGPWFTKREGWATVYVEARIGGGLLQEVAACGPTQQGPEQQEANATLIAEAPALYKELEALTGVVQSDPFLRYSEDSLYGKAIKAALAVLKKARGE